MLSSIGSRSRSSIRSSRAAVTARHSRLPSASWRPSRSRTASCGARRRPPRWLAALGGWAEPGTADRFARYCARAAGQLGDLIGWACTINEPNMVALGGYLSGQFPPGLRDVALRRKVNEVFADAHRKGVE